MVRSRGKILGNGWRLSPPLSFTLLALILLAGPAAAKPKLIIGKAVLNTQGLTVKGSYRGGSAASVDVYDSSGRRLGSPTLDTRHRFSLTLEHPDRTSLLCSVQAKADTAIASKLVAGRPKNCGKTPICKIQTPTGLYATAIKTDATFEGKAQLRDKQAAPLRIEWDFAGGSMGEPIPGTQPQAYKRPDTAKTTVQFERDNAWYRVRFTAWDKLNRYCEDSVMVKVGNPPSDLPDLSGLVSDAQQSAPATGSQLSGIKDEVVVLPYADLTLPGTGDYRYQNHNEVVTAYSAFSTLNAVAYKKAFQPPVLDGDQAAAKYAAASNPNDPVGAGSINTTSQNWPLNADITKSAPFESAKIQKTDMWELFERPASDPRVEWYVSKSWVSQVPHYDGRDVAPDEGYVLAPLPGQYATPEGAQGRFMPGRGNPYAANELQDFTAYNPVEQRHIARAIPLTDIDDSGRVNPYPLLRVQIEEKDTGKTVAADAVVGTARDVHCRECHAKGKIAANDQFDWDSIQQAYHSSKFYGENPTKAASGCWTAAPFCSTSYSAPKFLASVDREGNPSDSIFDQEFAASRNIGALHDFYDWTEEVGAQNGGPSADGSGYAWDGPFPCSSCHRSRISAEVGDPWVWTFTGFRGANQPTDSVGTLSEVIHNFHEQLQLNPDDPGKILREANGRPKLWDPATGANPNTLFPTVKDGEALPMEQNCLRCHGGHREPLYRDRMYTAGVTCYDCHGDMRAVGSAFEKAKPGTGGATRRLGWYEQPDCGSCHTGDAIRGQDGSGGYYSAGVMKRAFEDSDRTASPRTPITTRFAVQPGNRITMPGIETDVMEDEYRYRDKPYFRGIQVALYRNSRDTHGNVPCAACHGGAHENWPNRDP
ncbi:MAG: cytochrome C, partial [Methylococcaceae bacterium]|nr:cytochrome C [Methylococcaceae bacterium]